MIQRYAEFWFFREVSLNSFSTTFCVWLFKNNVSHVIFYQLTKFLCLIVHTFWGIGQYAYCKCLFPKFLRFKNCILVSRKMFLILYYINWPNFIVWLPLLFEQYGQYVYWNCLFHRIWRHKFWNWPYLSNQVVFLHNQKFKKEIKHLENDKSF